ncbi:MAG TPA: PIG-L deacetylase family protein [Patescibacteria group bacterium]|nr:PIG-L deacetylase family protein [Patescibacteria group bacterium]
MFTYEQIFKDKHSVLFVTAHPDDILVYYAALVHKLRKENKNVYAVTVTNGARGSGDKNISESELSRMRIKEETAALKFLGVNAENTLCLDYKDGEVESNYKFIGEISKYIRKFKADIVCTHEPTAIYQATYKRDGFFVQHRDHRKVAEAVVDAVYPFSRDRSFFPEQIKEGIEPHTLYDIVMTDEISCNFELDYTEDLEVKKAAMRIHKSQFDEAFINDIVDTVRNNDRYVEKYFYVKLLW